VTTNQARLVGLFYESGVGSRVYLLLRRRNTHIGTQGSNTRAARSPGSDPGNEEQGVDNLVTK